MPVLPAQTLDGKMIDADYFKGHLTVVTFMYIGCPPCMHEIATLNRLHKTYGPGGKVQVLCIARQMREQMIQFNGDGKNLFSSVRDALGAEPIQYAIQPACPDAASKMEVKGDDTRLKSECSIIEDTYGIQSYPTIFYVDGKGIIRKMRKGGPAKSNSESFYNELKSDVDSLLGTM